MTTNKTPQEMLIYAAIIVLWAAVMFKYVETPINQHVRLMRSNHPN